MENDVIGVALAKEICPICGKEISGPLLINRELTPSHKRSVEKLNGKVIGLSNKACDICAAFKDSAVFFIGIDTDKSNKESGIYRTGQVVGVRKESEFVKDHEEYLMTLEDGTRYAYIEESAGVLAGLWKGDNEAKV